LCRAGLLERGRALAAAAQTTFSDSTGCLARSTPRLTCTTGFASYQPIFSRVVTSELLLVEPYSMVDDVAPRGGPRGCYKPMEASIAKTITAAKTLVLKSDRKTGGN
jgi:hypothetical protein